MIEESVERRAQLGERPQGAREVFFLQFLCSFLPRPRDGGCKFVLLVFDAQVRRMPMRISAGAVFFLLNFQDVDDAAEVAEEILPSSEARNLSRTSCFEADIGGPPATGGVRKIVSASPKDASGSKASKPKMNSELCPKKRRWVIIGPAQGDI